ncbi:hypothetical protein OKW96_16415 [Sphingobacterium sp. KU25419]|nr:hypothetical protein OKW96_16415 [Sphingobacterium sp. KU25419]
MDEASFTKLKTSGGNIELQNTLTQLKERKEELQVQINGFNYNTIGPMSSNP